jgi:hypothetical protein
VEEDTCDWDLGGTNQHRTSNGRRWAQMEGSVSRRDADQKGSSREPQKTTAEREAYRQSGASAVAEDCDNVYPNNVLEDTSQQAEVEPDGAYYATWS